MLHPNETIPRLVRVYQQHSFKLAFVIIVFCLAAAVGLVVRVLRQANEEARWMYSESVHGLALIGELQYQTQEARRSMLYSLTTTDSNLQVDYATQSRAADERVAGMIQEYLEVAREPGQREVGQRLEQDWQSFLPVRDEVIASILEGSIQDAVARDLEEGIPGFNRVRNDLQEIKHLFKRQAELRLAEVQRASSRTTWKLVIILGLTLLFTVLTVRAVQKGKMRALQQSEKELKTLNETLEERVAERTAAAEERAHELARSEESLRRSEERYALAARGANDGLWDWNLKTNELYFSPRWKAMLGYEDTDIANSPEEWFKRIHPEDLNKVHQAMAAHLQALTPHYESEHRMLRQNGAYCWVLSRGVAVRDNDGEATRLAGSQTDINQAKVRDALTGLPNRLLFMDQLERAIKKAKRHRDYMFALFFLDLDRFKLLNDSLGHLVGDQLLVAAARRLESCLRSTDTIARYEESHVIARLGGDEFTVLLEDIRDGLDAALVAERLQKELSLPFNLNGHEVFTTASIGIAVSATGYERPEELLRDADTAMYLAKAHGKARFEFFNPEMRERAMVRMKLETDLRKAIERTEFVLYYQPIVSLDTGETVGFEALVRWQHPDRGLVSPAEFIPVAEETDLIVSVDRWVLGEACRQMSAWQARYPERPPLMISVNFSSRQFLQMDLSKQISQVLSETGLEAGYLKLEITESLIMEDVDSATSMLLQLKTLGVKVGIDDFGTGYSSLSYLHQFPIDTLKVDRSFVSRMGPNGENSELVRTIVTLGQNLGLDVIAEGVETGEQLTQLRTMRCNYGQGYYFSKPLDSEGATALIVAAPVWLMHDLPASFNCIPSHSRPQTTNDR